MFISSFKKVFNRISKTWLVFFLGFIIIESALFIFQPRFNVQMIMLNFKKEIFRESKVEADILIMGDSMPITGLVVEEAEKITGKKIYNMAVPGSSSMASFYFLFNDYLNHNTPPKTLIFLIACPAWEFTENNLSTIEIVGSAYAYESFYESLKDPLTIPYLYRIWFQLLPSKRFRSELTANLNIGEIILGKRTVNDFFSSISSRQASIENSLIKNKGGNYFNQHSSESFNKQIAGELSFTDLEFKPSSFSYYFFKKIADLSKLNNVKILLVRPITYGPVLRSANHLNYYRSCNSNIDKLASEFNLDIINDYYYVVEDENSFTDSMNHLIKSKAREFTKEIMGEALKFIK